MHRSIVTSPAFAALRRLLAVGCVALVMALGAMVVNPALHALAHANETAAACGHGDHRHDPVPADSTADSHACAITLFAHGLTLVAPVSIPPATVVVWTELALVSVEEPLLTAARSLHAPPCGPPLV